MRFHRIGLFNFAVSFCRVLHSLPLCPMHFTLRSRPTTYSYFEGRETFSTTIKHQISIFDDTTRSFSLSLIYICIVHFPLFSPELKARMIPLGLCPNSSFRLNFVPQGLGLANVDQETRVKPNLPLLFSFQIFHYHWHRGRVSRRPYNFRKISWRMQVTQL